MNYYSRGVKYVSCAVLSDFTMDFKYNFITKQEVLFMILLYDVKHIIKNHCFFWPRVGVKIMLPETPTFL